MPAHSGTHRKRRRFTRKYGLSLFLVFAVGAAMALVALLMFVLGAPGWSLSR